jgi:RNA polymerase sigma factor for flagellar operon FliA
MSVATCPISRRDWAAPATQRVRSRHLPPRHAPRPRPGSREEEQAVERHLPLVKTIVQRMALNLPAHANVNDLYSAALLGLLDAVRRYNPRCHTAFDTYARIRIRGAVLDELRRLDWAPRSVHRKARQIQNAILRVEQAKGRPATDHEVARAMKLSLAAYRRLVDEARPVAFVCLDAATESEAGDGASVRETVADPAQESPWETTARRELAEQIAARLAQLPPRQRRVLTLYYYEGLRLREIAEVLGLTESRICQIHAQAILALKPLVEDVVRPAN